MHRSRRRARLSKPYAKKGRILVEAGKLGRTIMSRMA